jgi:hypothetical protein
MDVKNAILADISQPWNVPTRLWLTLENSLESISRHRKPFRQFAAECLGLCMYVVNLGLEQGGVGRGGLLIGNDCVDTSTE